MLAVFAVRGARWAYALFVGMALLYFPQKGGFDFQWPACSWGPRGNLVTTSLTNYSHIILIALLFLISYAHFAKSRLRDWTPLTVATIATLLMSAIVEVAQGASDTGKCELRDLIPDIGGMLVGMVIVLLVKAGQERWRAVVPVADGDD